MMSTSPPPGRKAPFEEVVRTHGPSVLRVCRAVVGEQDAGDAWSDTFMSALRAYPELPATANVEAWLVTIAHRRAIDLVRARQRRPVSVSDLDANAGGGAPSCHGSAVQAVEAAVQVYSALAALPPRQRQVVAYHHLAGLPYRQIAEIVGGSEAAARRAASDGMATLRARLVPDDQGGLR